MSLCVIIFLKIRHIDCACDYGNEVEVHWQLLLHYYNFNILSFKSEYEYIIRLDLESKEQ